MTAGRVLRRRVLVSTVAVAALLTILVPPGGPSTGAEAYTQQDRTSPIGSTLPGPETTSTTAPATGSPATSVTVTSTTAATPGAPTELSVPITGVAPADAGTRSSSGWFGWFIALAGLGAVFAAALAAVVTIAERRATSPVAATAPGPPVPEPTESARFRGRSTGTGTGAEADIDDLIAVLGDSPLGTALAEAKRIDERIEALIDIVDLSADRHLASLAALALERRSVAPFGQAGQRFDPLRHNALGRVTVSDATQHRAVVNVDRQGWMNREGQVVRKAYVTVGLHEAGSSSSL